MKKERKEKGGGGGFADLFKCGGKNVRTKRKNEGGRSLVVSGKGVGPRAFRKEVRRSEKREKSGRAASSVPKGAYKGKTLGRFIGRGEEGRSPMSSAREEETPGRWQGKKKRKRRMSLFLRLLSARKKGGNGGDDWLYLYWKKKKD